MLTLMLGGDLDVALGLGLGLGVGFGTFEAPSGRSTRPTLARSSLGRGFGFTLQAMPCHALPLTVQALASHFGSA